MAEKDWIYRDGLMAGAATSTSVPITTSAVSTTTTKTTADTTGNKGRDNMSAQTTFELAEFLQFSGGSSPPMGASVATALSARTAETDAAADHLLMQPHLNQQQWQPAPLTVDNTRPDAIRVPALASACDVSTVPSATSAPVPPLLAKSPSAIASKPATPLELLFRHQQQQQLQLQAELKRDREKHLLLQQQQQQEQERVRELERERLRQEQMRLSTQSQSYSTDFDGHSWNLFDTVFDDGGASQEAMNMSALEAFAKYGSNSSTGGLPGSSSGGAMSSLLLDPIVTASYLSALHHQSQGTLPINQLATNFSATINPAALMGGGTDSGELLSADFYPDYVVRGGDPLAVLASSSGIGSPTVASASDSAQSLATIRHRPSSAGSRAAPAKRKTVSTHSPKRRQSSAVAVSDSDRAAMLAALRDASGSYFALDSTVQRSADGIAVVPALDHLAESGFPDTSRRVAEPGVALPLQLADGIHGAPSEQSRSAVQLYATATDAMLVFYTPRVGQKSYGTERRFFSPPPMALLHNVGLQESADNVATMVRLSIDGTGCLASEDCGGNVVSGDSLHHHHLAVRSVMAIFRNVFAGDLKALTAKFQRLYSVNCIAGEIDKAGVTAVQSMFERMLFRDTDRSRQFEFHIRLCPPCDAYQPQCYIGLFSSAPVSLVSKPAKKKSQQRLTDSLNTRASEDLVCSGQTVAFFNRIRGQNVATRFLGLSDLADTLAPLVVKSMDWDAFIIELSGVSTPASTTSSARLIYDGDEVVLRSTRHKWVSPALIVRSVDQKGAFAADTRIDLVTQMQKVAFEYRDYPNHFMNVDPKSSSVTVFNAATSSVHQSLPSTTKDQEALSAKRQRCDSGHVRATQSLVESAIWTILGVDCRQYHWFDPRAKLTTLAKGSNVAPAPERPALMRRMPVTPVPRLFHAQVEGHEMTLDISLHLLQLLDQLSDVELVTTFDQLDHYLAYDVFVGGLPCTTLRVLHNLDAIRGCLLDDKGDATKAASAMTDVPGECKAQIVCRLPKVNDCMQTAKPTSLLPNGSSTLAAILSALPDGTNVIELPILLVRRADGIVYRMHSNVQYLVVT